MIRVTLTPEDYRKRAAVEEALERLLARDPSYNGAAYLVEPGDFTAVESGDAYLDATTHAAVVDALEGGAA